LHRMLIMAIQDTSKAIFETTVNTRNEMTTLFEKVASRARGMWFCPMSDKEISF
jgi:hypothetical protein